MKLFIIIRLLGWGTSPLWYDEAISLHRATLPFWQHISVHVNAWEIILRAFATPQLIRIPALIASLLTAWIAIKVTDQLNYTPAQKTVTLITLSTLPGLIWMAQDARYYAGVGLLFVTSLYFALSARWLGLAGILGISIYIHPSAPIYILPACLIAAITLWRTPGKLAFIACTVLTWVPFLYPRETPASFPWDDWLIRSDLPFILEQFSLAIGANAIPPLLASLLVFVALVLASFDNERPWLPLVIFYVPVITLIAISVYVKPIFIYRTAQPLGIALAFVLGSAFTASKAKYIGYAIISACLIIGMVNYDPATRGGHIDRIAQIVNVNGGCVEYENEFTAIPMRLLIEVPPCNGYTYQAWLITTQWDENKTLFAASDGWHFPAVYLYSLDNIAK